MVRAVYRVYSPCDPIIYLIRCLVFYAAKDSFWFFAAHTPGVENDRADHLSQDHVTQFLSSSPQGTNQQGALIPMGVAAILGGDTHRLEIQSLDPAVLRYFSEALASSTKRSYQAGQKCYLDFCKFTLSQLMSLYFAILQRIWESKA